jgi:cyclopropane fatty-acyl-phospholipid synthase-like methyltransferase
MTGDIKTMQLYPRAERIYADLEALGYGDGTAVPVAVLNQFDQLHYHGTQALDAAIAATGMTQGDRVQEIGSGWGGCARYLALTSGAQITAVELQADYDAVARDLTARAGLTQDVTHLNADYLALEIPPASFDHVVSWLALFHIPQRAAYLGKIAAALKPAGTFFAEDLYAKRAPAPEDKADFEQHLFPNSLVDRAAYEKGLQDAGFKEVQITDMTDAWTTFTGDRLEAFHAGKAAYVARHGTQGYETIETFYAKMHGFFTDGLVGGLQVTARKAEGQP